MAGVFVCYRRTPEVEHAAGRLYGDLAGEFGDASVFIDVDSVRPGDDWMAAIEVALSRCEVFLVLVHPGWTSDVRLKDREDVLRIEIETALERDLLVVPVLINDAADLRASELPNTLTVLARRQALPLRHRTWRADLSPLLEAIQHRLEPPPATMATPDSSPEDGYPTLGPHARGEDVFRLQEMLGRLGFDVGEIDGIYGRDTLNAVRDFQKSQRIPADGVAGPETWERLTTAMSDRTGVGDDTDALGNPGSIANGLSSTPTGDSEADAKPSVQAPAGAEDPPENHAASTSDTVDSDEIPPVAADQAMPAGLSATNGLQDEGAQQTAHGPDERAESDRTHEKDLRSSELFPSDPDSKAPQVPNRTGILAVWIGSHLVGGILVDGLGEEARGAGFTEPTVGVVIGGAVMGLIPGLIWLRAYRWALRAPLLPKLEGSGAVVPSPAHTFAPQFAGRIAGGVYVLAAHPVNALISAYAMMIALIIAQVPAAGNTSLGVWFLFDVAILALFGVAVRASRKRHEPP